MKKPPDTPEFARFTHAMRHMMGISKAELNKRIAETKREKRSKVSVFPVPAVSPKRVN